MRQFVNDHGGDRGRSGFVAMHELYGDEARLYRLSPLRSCAVEAHDDYPAHQRPNAGEFGRRMGKNKVERAGDACPHLVILAELRNEDGDPEAIVADDQLREQSIAAVRGRGKLVIRLSQGWMCVPT